jgi:hypothetical protein
MIIQTQQTDSVAVPFCCGHTGDNIYFVQVASVQEAVKDTSDWSKLSFFENAVVDAVVMPVSELLVKVLVHTFHFLRAWAASRGLAALFADVGCPPGHGRQVGSFGLNGAFLGATS